MARGSAGLAAGGTARRALDIERLDAALVLFCRRPRLAQGKQRLARSLGEAAALAVGEALLDCALEDAAAWLGGLVIAPDDPADAAWAGRLLERAATVSPQPGGNLGQRLNAVDRAARALGHERLLFIGSDAPSLTVPDLTAAARELERSDVVLIPAEDGGVVLMGGRRPWPELAALPWSEASLGDALERCCIGSGLTARRLPGSYDVDEAADLGKALRALSADMRPARRRLRELIQWIEMSQGIELRA